MSTLLIIEDEPITRSQLTAHFEKEGFRVVARENGNNLGSLIASEQVDLCLIDRYQPAGQRWIDADTRTSNSE
jgi:DNA-binding response OmpR family regulator